MADSFVSRCLEVQFLVVAEVLFQPILDRRDSSAATYQHDQINLTSFQACFGKSLVNDLETLVEDWTADRVKLSSGEIAE